MPPKRKNKKNPNSPNVSISPTRPSYRKAADKLMKRFYEPLVLQHVLGPTHSDCTQCEPLDSLDKSELDNCNLQRLFLNYLTYICDFKRGGATVTAIALEQKPAGVVFWVVVNVNVKDNVIKALEEILKGLAGLDGTTGDEQAAMVEERIFRCAAELGIPRVKSYWQSFQESLTKCLRVLDREPESEQTKGELVIPQCRHLRIICHDQK